MYIGSALSVTHLLHTKGGGRARTTVSLSALPL